MRRVHFTTLIFTVAVAFLIGSCTSFSVSRLTDKEYPPKPEDAPIRISTGDVDREYEEIAIISVKGGLGAGAEAKNEKLRKRARKLGADAVIRVSCGESTPSQTTARGAAVHFVDEEEN